MSKLKVATNLTCIRSTIVAMMMVSAFSANAQIPKFNSNSAASATVYLDFDGQVVKGTAWNWDSTIHARPSGLSSHQITEIFNRIAEDFRIFNINITTDSVVYKKAPTTKRVRVIFTPTSKWYGSAAGISFVNSFAWGDDTPAWVFSTLLEGNTKYIAEAGSHEIGHTLGLQHQSTYSKSCELINEYAEGKGTGEIGWAPIMGVGYYKNLTVWTVGTSIEGCTVIQNDINTISKGINNIGFRNDDHGNSRETATSIVLTNNNFQSLGIINNSADRDFFKIVVPRRLRLKARATPNSVGLNNSGADVDLFLTLIKYSGDTIGRYNPKTLLNASLDTVLASGTYFLAVDGTSNQNVSDYGSVGLYSLEGSVENLTAIPTILVRGDVKNNFNILHWQFDQGTLVESTTLEYSVDGTHFNAIKDVPLYSTSYAHRSPASKLFYRVKMVLGDETSGYSNVIEMNNAGGSKVLMANNIVQSSARVTCSGEYSYQLLDETGRLLGKGILTSGINEIPLRTLRQGILLLKVFNQTEQFHYKLLKQ